MNWKEFGSSHGLDEILSWHLPAGTEENHKSSVRVASVSRFRTAAELMDLTN
jgi:hypothetical protein